MPNILLNVLTHGNELAGKKAADELSRKYPNLIGRGLDIQVANELAFNAQKRFISDDLNRVFPGKPDGSYEQRRAHELSPIIASYDCVIDVHSTESGSEDVIIVTKTDAATMAVLTALSPRIVLFFGAATGGALISQARIGVAFELGRDRDERTVKKTVRGIEMILAHYGLLSAQPSFGFETKFFEVVGVIEKPVGAILEPWVKNFSLMKSGAAFARDKNGKSMLANEDFYPAICGNDNYETIFGFASRKLNLSSLAPV